MSPVPPTASMRRAWRGDHLPRWESINLEDVGPPTDPRDKGLQDVLRRVPTSAHELICRLAALTREVGLDSLAQALGALALANDAPPGAPGAPGAVGTPGRPAGSRSPVEPFNLIPGPAGQPAVCLPTVVAVANGTRAPQGLAMTLRLLREHLIFCGSGPKGLNHRLAIVVTDVWTPQALYESQRDLYAHARVAGLRLVAMIWDGARWQSVSF